MSGEAEARGRAGSVLDLTRCAFTWDQMTPHLDDYRCSAAVRGSFQETAPRKTTENTVKHCDGGVGSVVADHRGGGKSWVVITTLRTVPRLFTCQCCILILVNN